MRSRAVLRYVLTGLLLAAGPRLPAAPFIRGDANVDGALDISDVVHVLRHLFLGDPGLLVCAAAADADGSGRIEITDPIRLFDHLFRLGPPPRAPFPGCGNEPAPAALGCSIYPFCRAPPTASFTATPAAGEAPLLVALDAMASSAAGGSIARFDWSFGDGATGAGRTVSHAFLAPGEYRVRLTVTDDVGLRAGVERLVRVNGPACWPADPEQLATAIDPTVSTALHESAAFFYRGSDPIQRGLAAAAIDPVRAAVVRGQVFTRVAMLKVPCGGAAVSILGHPELGTTCTRADGRFDLVVNGGGRLTVVCARPGFVTVHRQVEARWQDFALVDDITMLPHEPGLLPLRLGPTVPLQVVRGAAVTDARGTRRPTLFFPAGIGGEIRLPGGWVRPAGNALTLRITELTRAEDGLAALPAELPPGLGLALAFEIEALEATAEEATGVAFDRDVSLCVENVLRLPIGTRVPHADYDRERGVWMPLPDGRAIRIVAAPGGVAAVDLDGDGAGDSDAALATLGITPEVRARLAELYGPGQELLWDCDPVIRPVVLALSVGNAATPFPELAPPANDLLDDPTRLALEGIEVENQVVERSLPIAGTPFRLHYSSARVPGRAAARTLRIPLAPAVSTPGLLRVDLEVLVAGQRHAMSFPPDPDSVTSFTWDGHDAYGRTVQGAQPVTVRIGHVFAGLVLAPAALERSFGVASGKPLTVVAPVPEIVRWRTWHGTIGGFDARGLGLGGWTLSAQHVEDRTGSVLHLGTGERRSSRNIGPGTAAAFPAPLMQGLHGVAAGPDGAVFVSYRDASRIYRLDRDGSLTLFIGAASGGFGGDGGPAAQAKVQGPTGLHVAADGSLWIADRANQRIRCVDRAGIIATIAGKGTAGFSGDGGRATEAELRNPAAVALGPDGSIYISDTDNHRVRRVGTDGIIATFAGTGVAGKGATGATPALVALNEPLGLAVGDDGSVYVADSRNHRVLCLRDGIVLPVIGGATSGTTGDGGPARLALTSIPHSLAFAPDGSLLVAENGNYAVRRIGTDGIASTFAGTKGNSDPNGQVGLAAAIRMGWLLGLTASPDGSVLVADEGNARVRRIAPILPGVSLRADCEPGTRSRSDPVPASIAVLAHDFDASGRHLMSRDALTGAVLLTLEHDARGLLERLADGDGNGTRIERGADGAPRAIIAPGGQRTLLALDSDGFLGRVTGPDGAAWRFTYAAGGLLASATSPSGSVARYEYDALGRLTLAEGVGPSRLVLERREELRGSCIPMRDALGHTWDHRVERTPNGGVLRQIVFPTGLGTDELRNPDGSRRISYPDFNAIQGAGTIADVVWSADQRLGVLASFPSAADLSIPLTSGLRETRTRIAAIANPQDPLSLVSQTETIVRDGRTWRSEYVQATRTFTLASPAGRRSIVKLDERGRVSEEGIDGLEPVRHTYDARGRWTRVAQGAGTEERAYTLAYDAAGSIESVTDPLGRLTPAPADPSGLPRLVATPAGPSHSMVWTPDGRLLEHLPPPVDAGDPATRFAYDTSGKLARLALPDGNAVDLDRDPAGRVIAARFPQGPITLAYDPITGSPTADCDPATDIGFQHLGPLLSSELWTGPFSLRVGLGYTSGQKVASTGIGGGNTVNFTFDADLLSRQAFASTAHGNPLLEIARDPRHGLITRLTLGGIVETRTLNGFGEVAERLVTANGIQVYRAALERDRLGRIVQAIETVGTVTVAYKRAYTAAGELERVLKDGAAQLTCTYDQNGNRTSIQSSAGLATAAFDAQDRLLRQGAISCAYTPAGELRRKTKPSGSTAYTHDALGRLLAVALPDGARVDYLHDGRGRRLGKRINGVFEQGFVYRDATRACAEVDRTRGIATLFAHATEDVAPDFIIINAAPPTGADYYLVKDHAGSVRLAISLQTGAVAQRIDYDAFGTITVDTNPALQPFGFLGGLHDRQTGLVRLGRRDYDPELGRFIARDPDLEPLLAGETNLYTLHGGDPVNAGAMDLDSPSRGIFPWTAAASQQRLAPSRVVPFLPEGPDLPGVRLRGIHRTRLESRCFAADPQAVTPIELPLPWASRLNP